MATTSTTNPKTFKVLFVVTSHDQLGNTGRKTGFWLEEFAAPYYVLLDNGVKITIASPKGGQPPIDATSEAPQFHTDFTKRFYKDATLQQQLSQTLKLRDVKAEDYDAIFYPGGHGPVFDLSNDADSIRLIETFAAQNKPVAAVCHGPGVFSKVKDESGKPLVRGKEVTGFSNTEEEAVQLTKVVPYLLEDKLKELGGRYSKTRNFEAFLVQDGLLITGQNPASSEAVGLALLKSLRK